MSLPAVKPTSNFFVDSERRLRIGSPEGTPVRTIVTSPGERFFLSLAHIDGIKTLDCNSSTWPSWLFYESVRADGGHKGFEFRTGKPKPNEARTAEIFFTNGSGNYRNINIALYDSARLGVSDISQLHMFQEIHEQADVFEKVLSHDHDVQEAARRLSNLSSIIFTGFGSSANAASYGVDILFRYAGKDASWKNPATLLEFGNQKDYRNTGLVAISQSGKTKEVVQAVKLLKNRGATTIALTNDTDSELAQAAHHVIPLNAGPEFSVAATKTFTATLLNLQLLVSHLAPLPEHLSLMQAFGETPEISRRLLESDLGMKELSASLISAPFGFLLAPESLSAIAREGALKFKEGANLLIDPYDWRTFFHGPVAMATEKTPVLLLPYPTELATQADVQSQLKAKGLSYHKINLPQSIVRMETHLAAIPYAMMTQLLAFYTAVGRGLNPDHPRNLTKVTRTSMAE